MAWATWKGPVKAKWLAAKFAKEGPNANQYYRGPRKWGYRIMEIVDQAGDCQHYHVCAVLGGDCGPRRSIEALMAIGWLEKDVVKTRRHFAEGLIKTYYSLTPLGKQKLEEWKALGRPADYHKQKHETKTKT